MSEPLGVGDDLLFVGAWSVAMRQAGVLPSVLSGVLLSLRISWYLMGTLRASISPMRGMTVQRDGF